MEMYLLFATFICSTTLNANITFVPGAASASTSNLSASPNSLIANGASTTTLVVTARDAQGNLVTGKSVTLSGSGTSNTFAAATGTTNASGQYTTTLKSTQVQTETITAKIAAVSIATASVTFTVGPPSATTSTLTVSPNPQYASGANTIVATATYKDAQSRGLSGLVPAWSTTGSAVTLTASGATSGSGVATATLQSTVVQNANVQAVSGAVTLVASYRFAPNPIACSLASSPNTQVADGNTSIALSATVLDANSQVIQNQRVAFTVSGGAGPVTPQSAVTAANGVAQVALRSTSKGTNLIKAQAGSIACTKSVTFLSTAQYCAGNPNYAATSYAIGATGASALNIATGEFNSDGYPDLATLGAGANTMTVWISNGTGSFGTSHTYNTGSQPFGLAVGDLNGDGNQDIVVGNHSAATLSVFLAKGGGLFNNAVSVSAGGVGIFSPIVTDVNNDGNLDVVVGASGAVFVYLGTGSGTFAAPVSYTSGDSTTSYIVAYGDFNKDGWNDLAVSQYSGGLNVLLNAGSGTYPTYTNFPADNAPYSAAVGDINGDGNQDIAVINQNSADVTVLLGNGAGAFSATNAVVASASSPSKIVVLDINGDSIPDYLVGNDNANLFSLGLGAGNGSFASAVSYPITPAGGFAVADYNQDGRMDIAIAYGSTAQVFLNIGCQ